MSFVRRSIAALSGLCLLQLLLLGSGTLCAMHQGAMRGGRSRDAMPMAGMVHQTTSHASTTSPDDAGAPTSPLDCGGSRDGCGLPFAPGQCSSMAACDISATPVTTIAASTYASTVAREIPALPLGHAGPTFAPELPPPRA